MSASSCATSDARGSAPAAAGAAAAAAEMRASGVNDEDEAELTSDEAPEEAAYVRDGARWLSQALRMSSSCGERYEYSRINTPFTHEYTRRLRRT